MSHDVLYPCYRPSDCPPALLGGGTKAPFQGHAQERNALKIAAKYVHFFTAPSKVPFLSCCAGCVLTVRCTVVATPSTRYKMEDALTNAVRDCLQYNRTLRLCCGAS